MPIYLIFHLSTSPTIFSRNANDFVVDLPQLHSLPISIVVGFLVPATALALPAPSVLTYDQKQAWLAAWQVFPIWTEISQQVLSFVLAKVWSEDCHSSDLSTARSRTMRSLRTFYVFVLAIAGITRMMTITLLLFSKFFPSVFEPGFRGVLSASNVLQPSFILQSAKMSNISEGALLLLQYDEMCGSSSLLIWSGVVFAKKYLEEFEIRVWTALRVFAIAACTLMIFGPCGLAIAMIWARDELVIEKTNIGDKKAN